MRFGLEFEERFDGDTLDAARWRRTEERQVAKAVGLDSHGGTFARDGAYAGDQTLTIR